MRNRPVNIFAEYIRVTPKMADIILQVKDKLFTWLEGSSQCGKSVAAALAFAALIEDSPVEDNLFLALGYTSTSVKNNVSFCGGFGLEGYFGSKAHVGKYYGSDALFIETRTGIKTVFFTGGRTQTANNGWHGFPIAGALVDEIDRVHVNSITELKQRIQAKPNAHIIVTQNPNLEKHPIYRELEYYQSINEVSYHHFTLDDNPALSEEELIKIKGRYDPTSIYYKRYVLGLRVTAEGLIYNVRDYNIIEEIDQSIYGRYVVVADPGINTSATSFSLVALRRDHSGVDVLKEYWHRNKDEKLLGIKMPADYAKDFLVFINECRELMGYEAFKIISDIDLTFVREVDRIKRSYGIGKTIHSPYKETIEERIKTGINYLYQGRLRFYKDCTKTIDSFKEAQYNEKKAISGIYERLDDPSAGTMIDCIDSTEYGMVEFEMELDRYHK